MVLIQIPFRDKIGVEIASHNGITSRTGRDMATLLVSTNILCLTARYLTSISYPIGATFLSFQKVMPTAFSWIFLSVFLPKGHAYGI